MIHYITLKTKKIVRDENGNKVIGSFPNWRNSSLHKKVARFSDIDTSRASAIVVGTSGLKVIDVDDNNLFAELVAINNTLADSYKCRMIIKSDLKGGHFYFLDTPNKLDNYLGNPQDGKKIGMIDYQTGNRLIFTWVNNDTKIADSLVDAPEDLTPLPDALANHIIAYSLKLENEALAANKNVVTSDDVVHMNHLAPLIINFLNSNIADQNTRVNSLNTFLQIVTPREYKKILKPQNAPFGTEVIKYHPNTFPEGGGAHNYLVSIGGVLMRDESVDESLYQECVTFINNLMEEPDKSVKTMIQRDISSDSFRFNPQWKNKTLTLTGKDGNSAYKIYLLKDGNSEMYMFVDEVKQSVMIGKKVAMIGIIHSMMAGGRQIKGSNIAERCLTVELINDPLKPFGLQPDNRFNIFKRNKVQQIFYNPEDFPELKDTTPTTTLSYLSHICGGEIKAKKFIGFLARKLKTHSYSPLIFVLWGVPGSGKNTLAQKLLAPLVEGRDIVNLTIDNLRDKFNTVFKERDFVMLDEVHTLAPAHKRDFINLINAISGKQKIAERRMYNSDLSQFNNELTILLTTNKPTEITTEANDRRIVVFRSYKTLSASLGMTDDEVITKLENEIYSFAYYLSQYKWIDKESYVKNYPWIEDDKDYEDFMTESKSIAYRIYKTLHTRNYNSLLDILFDVDITDEEFASMIVKEPKGYALRLLNSKPSLAVVNSLGDHPNLALKQENLAHELKVLAKEYSVNFMYVDALEYDDGIKTGNKKTAYRIDIDKLPEHIQEIIKGDKIDEIDAAD